MKRYKYIGLLLLAGLAAACQKETVAPAGTGYSTEAILFTTPYTVSKSAAMRDGDFKVGDKVGVLGYSKVTYTANGVEVDASTSLWDAKKEWAKPEVFYNQELTYEGNGVLSYEYTGWNPAPVGDLHPWYDEEDYTYAFFAYYPYAELGYGNRGTIYAEDGRTSMGTITLSGENATGDPTFTYEMPHEGESTGSSLDWDVVPDVMLAYAVDHVHSDGAVSLNFRHMLCAIEFEINNYNPFEVTIESLRFSGEDFYKSFTITGQEQDYTPNDGEGYSGYFNLLSGGAITCEPADTDENGVVIAPSNTKITVSRDSEDPVDLLFIPDADGKITERECTVTVETSEGDVRQQNIKEGMSFEPGTRSIFSINIIGNNFVIQVRTLDNWSDGGDSDIYFD